MEINFIPLKLRPKRPSRAPYLFAAMIYILAMLYFGSRAGMVNQFNSEAASDRELASTLNSNLAIYRDSRDELDRVKRKANELIALKRVFRGVHAGRVPIGRIAGEVIAVTPEGLFYEELEISYPSDKFLLQGFGEDVREKATVLRFSLEDNSVIRGFFKRVSAVSRGKHPDSDDLETFEIKLDFLL